MKRFPNFRLPMVALLLFPFLQNCHNNQSRDEKEKDSPAAQVSGSEDFGIFLDRFSREEFFQMKRIVFPIQVIVPDAQDEGLAPREDTIGKYDWELLDLSYDSTYALREYDRYLQNVVFRGDTAIVEMRGIDNGIYADYYFKLIGDKWFLVTLSE